MKAKAPSISDALGLYGNIFRMRRASRSLKARAKSANGGVETEHENVFFRGSAALRGGAVSWHSRPQRR